MRCRSAHGTPCPSNVSKAPLARLSGAVMPFIGVMLLVLMLITYVPQLTLWAIQ